MTECPFHRCSLCGRHIGHGRIVYRLNGRPLCVSCVDARDLYDDLDHTEITR